MKRLSDTLTGGLVETVQRAEGVVIPREVKPLVVLNSTDRVPGTSWPGDEGSSPQNDGHPLASHQELARSTLHTKPLSALPFAGQK
jgi:hypothetical protein